MPDKKISDLTSSGAIVGTEELPIVQSGSTVKTTLNAIATFFGFVKKGTITNNTILKGSGTDTATDSNITDDGTTVTVNSNTNINSNNTLNTYTLNNNGHQLNAQDGLGKGIQNNFLITPFALINSFYSFDGSDSSELRQDGKSNTLSATVSNIFDSPINNFPTLTASQIVETDASKNLVSVAKATGYNLALGTTAGTVLEGDKALLKTNNLSDLASFVTARTTNLRMWDLFLTNGDQTTTSNVAANITDLVSVSLTANKRYKISGIIHLGCNNTGGVKLQLTIPTGATMYIDVFGKGASGTAYVDNQFVTSATLTTNAVNTVNAALGFVLVNGEISLSSTAGVIQFGFASGANTQTSTIFQLGTQLTLTQIN